MNPRLDLSPEQMREYGYRVVDRIVNHLATLSEQPVGSKADPAAILARYQNPPPEQGADFLSLLDEVEHDVLRQTMHVNHPRFFAYVPGPSNFIGVLADTLAAGFNVFAGTWISGSGPTAIEFETIGWLRDLCGFPHTTAGLFVSGGTMANLTALTVARHARLGENMHGAVIYCSDQMHSSNEKAIRVLGFGREQLRKLPSNALYQLPVESLRQAVESDRAQGHRPFCVIATAGTTNTGAIDDLEAIAGLCAEQQLWLHVDGAYGAAAVISTSVKQQLAGLERADSLSLDPHKWLFQPFEAGCVLVRDGSQLRHAFQLLPEYLGDTHISAAEINPTDLGIQLTRSFRALKLWLSVKTFGMASFRAAIERGFELSRLVESELRRMPDWEVVTPAQMAVVCFRYKPGDAQFHLQLVQEILRDGFALITSTVLRGQTLLRTCTTNPRTTDGDVVETLRRMDNLARALASAPKSSAPAGV